MCDVKILRSSLKAVWLLLIFLAVGVAAEAANGTTAGTVKVTSGNQSLTVSAPYSGDDNANNTLQIEWGLSGVDFSLGNQLLPHAASPYGHVISGLTNFTAYQVRVTYIDSDGITGTAGQTFTGLRPNNSLLHNSLTTGSLKWSAQNGWGIPGGRYGEFTCNTCHVKNSSNIKRVRATVDAPDTVVDFPGGNNAAVSFQDARNDSADFGDDTSGHANSNRICEVCHSATKYHNFNTVNNTGGLEHFNKKDCTQCHAHGNGFKAGACSSCHGGGTVGVGGKNFWPDGSTTNAANDEPGRHLAHMSALAELVYGLTDATALLNDPAADSKQVDLCGYCHDNPGGDADHSAALPAETAFHPVWNKAAAAAGTYTTLSCTNIACHNGKTTTPAVYGWFDSGTSTCLMCHNDVTSDAVVTGETHNDHMNASAKFGVTITCATCHDAATVWGSVKPAANHLNGEININGISYAGSVPTATTFAGCGTNACHNAGTGTYADAPVNSGYKWSDDGLSDCGICHADVPTGGSHGKHVITAETSYGGGATWATINSTTTDYDFGCGKCHGSTVGAHLNRMRTVVGTGWNGTACNNTYCHSGLNAANTRVYATTPDWGVSFTGDKCANCHGNSPASGGHLEHQVGFHSNAIYSGLKDFLPVLNTDPIPTGLTGARAQLRGHGGTLLADGTPNSTTITCYICHNDTVTDKFNDKNPLCASCHDGTKAPTQGGLDIADKSKHVNNMVDIQFVNEKIRSKAQVRDDLFNVPELSNNWTRMNTYKKNDGSSYDEQPQTLRDMATALGGWNAGTKSCQISCHLWEGGRVDKYPVLWEGGAIICIDCHTRLPK